LDKDCVVVVRYQGPRAVGMPELHKLTPPLGVLQDKGFKVALVTDGRMSGASGKVPAAIHLYPEALDGGLIAKVQDGDIIEVNAEENRIILHVSDEELAARQPYVKDLSVEREAMGRELFNGLRKVLTTPEEGASCVFHEA
jgi:phosphogluconate dehydratase